MDGRDKERFVQQYVERQRAYLPTYTAEQLFDQRHPSKAPRSDEFGFDTPVLRPRVPANENAQSPLTPRAGPSKSLRTREAERGLGSSPREAQSETRDPALDKTRSKRKKASTPIDTDNERATRLADRRERKKKKRAIVNPPEKQDDDIVPTTASKKGRTTSQKVKKPAALALLYGFSATNVTKDRLTLKPAPSLGVFSKGRASGKKKVTATRKSSSRNELFSESAFLNKPSGLVADHSEIGGGSDDSSISNHPIPKEICSTKRTKKDRGKCTEGPALKTPQASTRTTAESEVWDIELQSKLPSSARDASSELGAKDSAPVVLDIRGAQWSASLDVAGEQEERHIKTRTPSLSVTCSPPRGHFVVRHSPALARSDLRDEVRLAQAADKASSIHPSHSASQVGCRAADAQPSDLRVVTSKYFAKPQPVSTQHPGAPLYFAEPKPVTAQEFAANPPQPSRSNDGTQLPNLRPGTPTHFTELEPLSAQKFGANPPQSLKSNDDIGAPDLQIPALAVNDPALDLQTVRRVTSPINSLASVLQPMAEFQTRYDIVALDFPSDSSPFDDYYGHVDVPWQPLGGPDRGDFECPVVETQGDRSDISALEQALEYQHPHRGDIWDWYAGSATYDVDFEGPLAPEHDLEEPVSAAEPCFFEAPADDDPGQGHFSEEWFCMGETEQDFPVYDEAVDGSICYSEEGLHDGESGEDVADFLEGRALLLGVPEDHEERSRCVGLSGLVQAEMDVASRLRDHWRPLRL